MAKTGWKVNEATVSTRNGGLYVMGNNYEQTGAQHGEHFSWHIDRLDARYDFSTCVFGVGAEEVYERFLAVADRATQRRHWETVRDTHAGIAATAEWSDVRDHNHREADLAQMKLDELDGFERGLPKRRLAQKAG